MWHKGSIYVDGIKYIFYVKSYEFPSQYGIDGGKISKLEIRRNDITIVQYDRGWVSKPVTKAEKEIFEELVKIYN